MKDQHPSRRHFLGSLAGCGTLAGLGACAASRAAAGNGTAAPEHDRTWSNPPSTAKKLEDVELTPPNGLNLIVLISDTFRWDYLHFNGNDRIRTPNLDALAADGVYFSNCYADGLPTIPSRRVMHTGRSILPERTKWHPLWPEDVTLAEVAGRAGMRTGFVVDTYHHFKPSMNFHNAFDSWIWIRGQETDRWVSGPKESVRPEDHVPAHLLRDNENLRRNMIQYLLNTRGRTGEEDYFCARSLDASARWLEQNSGGGRPFLLFVDMFDPHEPWDAPPRFQRLYRERYPFERTLFGYGVRNADIRESDLPYLIDLYSAEVTFMDHCLGRFFDRLKSMKLWENTVIVFSTDHGTHLGEQGCVQKHAGLLNSCVARIPLIIRHPEGRAAGRKIDAFASHLDFMPTFLDLVGVRGYERMDGRSLWPLVTGERESLRERVVTGYGNFGAVRTRRWHYFQNIWGDSPGHGPSLYDLEQDPGETRNVAGRHPKTVENLRAILSSEFRTEIG